MKKTDIKMKPRILERIGYFLSLVLLTTVCFYTAGQTIPEGYLAKGVVPVGYCDMDGRPAFKMSIKEHKGRWYLFTGHFWDSGWSVTDVTDPANPKVVKFIPGPPNTWTLQMELHGNIMVTSLERIFPIFGGNDKPFTEGVYLWDISDPLNPERLGHYTTGGSGTHRNFYNGGNYMHLAAGMPGYMGNIYVIVDISDPAKPVEVSRWWVPGQHESEEEYHYVTTRQVRHQLMHNGRDTSATTSHHPHHMFCGSDHEVSLHGPPYVVDSLAFLPYGAAGMIVLDISDITKPRQVSRLDFSPPFHNRFGVHGALPITDQGIAFVNSEDVSYGQGPLSHASIVDIRDIEDPKLLSLFPQPLTPEGTSYRQEKGWSGPHNFNHLIHNPDVQPQGDLFYMTWFNAGLRVYDVADKYVPKEVGHFVPPAPTKRYGSMPEDELVVQTEDVLVDRRGYIYITDKNQGIYILKME
ncbi:hypothetical protein C5745_07575 [Sphingobacterium haloxyli]|uniref:Uncharacterized protein n=2 Tax=Sphingobacterium haloxyli TaxID=2100533 RepID=A0A2S9J4Q6_9SPHI|nr:hypothetical protein C5745_07575 [Sphingobacterium haloxyli]